MNEWIGQRLNAQFQPISKGMVECPKCFGATELDMTPRNPEGWPLGSPCRMTCDHCEGEGEVKPATGWPEPAKSVVQPTGWAMFND